MVWRKEDLALKEQRTQRHDNRWPMPALCALAHWVACRKWNMETHCNPFAKIHTTCMMSRDCPLWIWKWFFTISITSRRASSALCFHAMFLNTSISFIGFPQTFDWRLRWPWHDLWLWQALQILWKHWQSMTWKTDNCDSVWMLPCETSWIMIYSHL